MGKFDAAFFSKIFVREANKVSNGISYRHGVARRGNGTIPYDTGKLAKSITLTYAYKNTATIIVGNSEEVRYAEFLENNTHIGTKNRSINMHYHFIERFAVGEFVNALRKYGKVTVGKLNYCSPVDLQDMEE